MKTAEKEIPTRIISEFGDVAIMFVPAGMPVNIDHYLFQLAEPVFLRVEAEQVVTRVVALKGKAANPRSEAEARLLVDGVKPEDIACESFRKGVVRVTPSAIWAKNRDDVFNVLNVSVDAIVWPIIDQLTISRSEYLKLAESNDPIVNEVSQPYIIMDCSSVGVSVISDSRETGVSSICYLYKDVIETADIPSNYIYYWVFPDGDEE